jgi:hypothetical protein
MGLQMFEVFVLEGQYDILQYVKLNPLALTLQKIVKCQANHYPSHCMIWFPEVYSAADNCELGLKVSLTKAAEEGGYTLRQTKNYKTIVLKKANVTVKKADGWTYTLGGARSRIYQNHKMTDIFEFIEDVCVKGHKTTCIIGSRAKEYRGSPGKILPQKTTTTLPVEKEDRCPFSIDVYYGANDGRHYLSSKDFVRNFLDGVHCSHLHHEELSVLFSSQNDIDEHVVKMVKQFAICNSSPATAARI